MNEDLKNTSHSKKSKILATTTTVVRTKPDPGKDLGTTPSERGSLKWVPYYDKTNAYPNDLAFRIRRTATLSAIINSKRNYTKGSGFLYFQNDDIDPIAFSDLDDKTREYLKEVNNEFQSFHDIYSDAALSYISSGNAYILCVKKTVGDQEFTAFFCLDYTEMRVSWDGNKFYRSAFWEKIGTNPSPAENYKVIEYEAWNGEVDTSQEKFVIHLKRKEPGFQHYGVPDFLSVLKDADIEYKVDIFNLDRLTNGFFPSAHIAMYGEPPEGKTPKEHVIDVVDHYTDEGNGSKIYAEIIDNPEAKTEIHEFSTHKDGEFLKLEESAYKGQVRGLRWFPALSGIETSGKLGSNQELINQHKIVMESMIIPDYQMPLNKIFNKCLEIAGINYQIKPINRSPVGIDDKLEPKFLMEANEQRKELGLEPKEKLDERYLFAYSTNDTLQPIETIDKILLKDVNGNNNASGSD